MNRLCIEPGPDGSLPSAKAVAGAMARMASAPRNVAAYLRLLLTCSFECLSEAWFVASLLKK